MSRYIDADLAIKAIENDCSEVVFYTKQDAIDCIQATPTADVVEVVRCKDCKYYTEHYQGTDGEYGRCDHPQQEYEIECYDMWVVTNPDDYCSYGERREDK